jgi:hypothetical protein
MSVQYRARLPVMTATGGRCGIPVLPRQLAVDLRLLPFPGLRWGSVWLAPGQVAGGFVMMNLEEETEDTRRWRPRRRWPRRWPRPRATPPTSQATAPGSSRLAWPAESRASRVVTASLAPASRNSQRSVAVNPPDNVLGHPRCRPGPWLRSRVGRTRPGGHGRGPRDRSSACSAADPRSGPSHFWIRLSDYEGRFLQGRPHLIVSCTEPTQDRLT